MLAHFIVLLSVKIAAYIQGAKRFLKPLLERGNDTFVELWYVEIYVTAKSLAAQKFQPFEYYKYSFC